MRLLVSGSSGLDPLAELDRAALFAAYRPPANGSPDAGWLRCNMVTSLDGAATGADGKSGSINNAADHAVFEVLRAASHAVVVGAGTIRAEGYPPLSVAEPLVGLRRARGLPDALPLVAVTHRGEVPPTLRGYRDGSALIAMPGRAPGLARARDDLGEANVLVCGGESLDLRDLVDQLHARGLTQLLTEGGPSLLGSFIAAGLVDELCYTIAPHVVGGEHPRTVGVDGTSATLELALLVEQDSTIMGRWFVQR
ncbi:deaminase [Humibacillus sp. DSM 29435]|uniref:dihydrofolate reductase family protein n=1 Tax=Humibacillus sp. DSM 29435 TaxID=1869167 RepID=UPI00087234F3|nr:dihydrofolate reductase family protein [Humibacillus sp. DSM 29435]OFE14367.1 deaminase [Humibacillus sp. DSM 29435]